MLLNAQLLIKQNNSVKIKLHNNKMGTYNSLSSWIYRKRRPLLLLWAILASIALVSGPNTLPPVVIDILDGEGELSEPVDLSSFSGVLKDERQFYEILSSPQTTCRKRVNLGGGWLCKGLVDGDKEVCLDKGLDLPQGDCLVYSFGVGNDITFEYSLSMFKHCELHMFDPAVNTSEMNDLEPGQHFHRLGLGLENEEVSSKDFKIQIAGGLTMPRRIESRTLERIISDLGHKDREIHYLKIDVEGHEWKLLPHLVQQGSQLQQVHQLSMELHTDHFKRQPYETWLPQLQIYSDTLRSLEALGFRRVSYRDNYNYGSFIKLPYEDKPRPSCGEIFYINQRFHIS